jgi:cell division protein FtsQ
MVDGTDIPLPGELGDEEESPYRRRAKTVPVRRSRAGRLRRSLPWLFAGALALALASLSGYWLARYALTSPHFLVASPDHILVSGNQFVSREEVVNALGLPFSKKLGAGIPLLRVSLEQKRQQVMTLPWVRSATVARAFPNTLVVSVVERTPVAFLNFGGHLALIDEEGVVLDKPAKATFDFPVLTGLEAAGDARERRARVGLYTEFLRRVAEDATASGWLISEVDLSDSDDLRALLARGSETISVHFGHEDFRERFQNFLALLPELRTQQRRIDSIDLRYRNQVVVNPERTGSLEAGSEALPPLARQGLD